VEEKAMLEAEVPKLDLNLAAKKSPAKIAPEVVKVEISVPSAKSKESDGTLIKKLIESPKKASPVK